MHKVLLVLVVIVGVFLWAEPALAQEAAAGAAAEGMHINLSQTITVIVYLMILGYLGYLGYRRSKTAEDYLLAGRNVHPYVMALSYGARLSPRRRLSVSGAWRGWSGCRFCG